jgi:hypothetical protein
MYTAGGADIEKDAKGADGKAKDAGEGVTVTELQVKPRKPWIWWSTDPKFFHEIGFLASFFQFIAATVFWISGSVFFADYLLPPCFQPHFTGLLLYPQFNLRYKTMLLWKMACFGHRKSSGVQVSSSARKYSERIVPMLL